MAMEGEQDKTQDQEPEADGYYGDDDATDEELDLSFLDEEEADEEAGDAPKK